MRSHPLVGSTDKQGQLIMHVLDAGTAAETIVPLRSDFGIMMCRMPDSGALFVIGNKAKASIQEFTNYDDFLAALDEVPVDSVLTIHDRCLMPQFHDFYPVHFELLKKFRRECGERGLRIAKEDKIFCTCKEAA
jgi:hypothetical protein